MIRLGDFVQDKISGLRGVVTGRAEYLFEATKVLVVPCETYNGAPVSGTRLDAGRVERVTESKIGLDTPC